SVAPLVETEDMVVAGEVGRDLVPAVRRLRAAVQEQQRRPSRGAPVEEVEAEAVQRRVTVGGAPHPSSRTRTAVVCPGGRVSLSARARYRCGVIPVGEALAVVCNTTPLLDAERVALADALGRVAAEDVVSTRTVPNAANSAMDGFAVRHADVAATPA